MTFLGVSAVEDTLQWNAPETISMLRKSGIQVWICTGDKYETTLGVAHACSLTKDLSEEQYVELLEADPEVLSKTIKEAINKILSEDYQIGLLGVSAPAFAVITS